MINHAIGAKGVVSQECKAVVEQYGQTIIDLLLAQVGFKGSPCYLQLLFSVPGQVFKLYICNMLQAHPKKICSQVGLCMFDGTRGVRLVLCSAYFLWCSGYFKFLKYI